MSFRKPKDMYACPGTPTIRLEKIPGGYDGTLRTVEHIVELIKQGAKDFHVRQTAIDILVQRAVNPKDYLGEIKALFEWVQQNVRYTRDTVRVEVLHSAHRMLELRAGDCDDMAILLGAMLESIGHPVRLVLSGPDPLKQDLFHPYLCGGIPQRSLDFAGCHHAPPDGLGAEGAGEKDNRYREETQHDG